MSDRMTKERLKEIGELSMDSNDIDIFKHTTTELYNEVLQLKEQITLAKGYLENNRIGDSLWLLKLNGNGDEVNE